jgi:hypothetical protein
MWFVGEVAFPGPDDEPWMSHMVAQPGSVFQRLVVVAEPDGHGAVDVVEVEPPWAKMVHTVPPGSLSALAQ